MTVHKLAGESAFWRDTCIVQLSHNPLFFKTLILPGKLTENTFSFTATTWGIVTEDGVMKEQIGNWQ